jgi:hypothetical protein
MSWTINPTLLNPPTSTPCKEIFQAVCDEIGAHYQQFGYKYTRSRPKVVVESDKLKLEITFWSSGSNTPGEHVNLEILPNFYAKQLAKTGVQKGFLFGHTALFYHKYTDDKTKIKVNQIYGEVSEYTDPYSHHSEIRDNRNCDIYGLDKARFDKIIAFIDTKILSWISKLQTEDGLLEFLKDANPTRIHSIDEKRGNTNFPQYMLLNFPNIDLNKLLGF